MIHQNSTRGIMSGEKPLKFNVIDKTLDKEYRNIGYCFVLKEDGTLCVVEQEDLEEVVDDRFLVEIDIRS